MEWVSQKIVACVVVVAAVDNKLLGEFEWFLVHYHTIQLFVVMECGDDGAVAHVEFVEFHGELHRLLRKLLLLGNLN